ncbi:hypothetical protein LOD99_8372 [Oopsacas minuta]|uniref:Uncharacterized protein n=1 Tax=Oopsacas minuta TaxID=111878 RepID=A0AAV7JGH3_9METZ|nr:hypothetical protein LOD99_8372 [Oopsacas minuta]
MSVEDVNQSSSCEGYGTTSIDCLLENGSIEVNNQLSPSKIPVDSVLQSGSIEVDSEPSPSKGDATTLLDCLIENSSIEVDNQFSPCEMSTSIDSVLENSSQNEMDNQPNERKCTMSINNILQNNSQFDKENQYRPDRTRKTASIHNILERNLQMEELGQQSACNLNKKVSIGSIYANSQSGLITAKKTTNKHVDKPRRISVKLEIILWRIFIIIGMLLVWSVVLIPVLLSSTQGVFEFPHNTTINEELLIKANLTNKIVTCPFQYKFSPVVNSCQPICGKWSSCGPICYYFERATYTIIAIAGIITSCVALVTWIRLSSNWKFHHHPIFIGIIVNLIQSIAIGIIDIPGAYYFTCGGKDVDDLSVEKDHALRTQILGAIIHSFALSNRIWFVVALIYILLRISFPLREIFTTRKMKIILITIEIIVCICIPLLTEVITFATGSLYVHSPKILLPVPDNRLFAAFFGFVPHAFITSFTMSVILLIIYKIRTQIMANNTKIQGIEKRLLFFSGLYFLLTVIVAVSVSIHLVIDSELGYRVEEYRATLTLNSMVQPTNNSFASNNTVLSLLPIEDRLRITDVSVPLQIYLSAASNRLMFIVVFAVTYINVFSISRVKALFNLNSKPNNVFTNKNARV